MKNRRPNLFLLMAFAVITLGSYIYYQLNHQSKYNWEEAYKIDREEPFDLKFAHQLLQESAPGRKFIFTDRNLEKFLKKYDTITNSSFIYIGLGYQVDQKNAKLLSDYISRGNTLMLSCSQIPSSLMNELFMEKPSDEASLEHYPEGQDEYGESQGNVYAPSYYSFPGYQPVRNDSIQLQWNASSLKATREFVGRHYELDRYSDYFWNTFDSANVYRTLIRRDSAPVSLQVLETVNHLYPGMVRIKYGKGWLLLHPNPLLFTNYFILDRSGFNYVSAAFSYLNRGPIIWELYGQHLHNDGSPASSATISKSPLKYILSQPPLRLAWYILLLMVLLFLLFRSKRTQRKIPVLEEKSNDSEEYYSTISRLYYINRDNLHLGKLMYRHFQLVCRRKFLINIQENQKRAIEVLSKKTGLSVEAMSDIFKAFDRLNQNIPLTDEEIIGIYMKLRTFYHQVK